MFWKFTPPVFPLFWNFTTVVFPFYGIFMGYGDNCKNLREIDPTQLILSQIVPPKSSYISAKWHALYTRDFWSIPGKSNIGI